MWHIFILGGEKSTFISIFLISFKMLIIYHLVLNTVVHTLPSQVMSGHALSSSLLYLCHSGLLRTADGVSRSRLGVQSGVSRCRDDQFVTVPLVPLETAPELTPVPTSSSSPAATAAGGSGLGCMAGGGQVGQTSLSVVEGSRP